MRTVMPKTMLLVLVFIVMTGLANAQTAKISMSTETLVVQVRDSGRVAQTLSVADPIPSYVETLPAGQVVMSWYAAYATRDKQRFVKPVAISYSADSILVAVPYSPAWNVAQITLVNIPETAQPDAPAISVIVSGNQLTRREAPVRHTIGSLAQPDGDVSASEPAHRSSRPVAPEYETECFNLGNCQGWLCITCFFDNSICGPWVQYSGC